MKILIAVSALQTLAIVFLGARVMSMDAGLSVLQAAPSTQATTPAQSPRPIENFPSAAPSPAAGVALFPEDVRQIIREELAALDLSGAQQPGASARSPLAQSDGPVQTPETDALKNEVASSIGYYIAQGEIGESDMANLQLKIARLPPAQRTEMLGRLTRAMNRGELKGQF